MATPPSPPSDLPPPSLSPTHPPTTQPSTSTSTLTQEQRERIQRNRERALQIQRERKENQQQQQKQQHQHENGNDLKRKNETVQGYDGSPTKKSRPSPSATEPSPQPSLPSSKEPLEDFEEGASELVTLHEARNVYCLPEGSLAVCQVEERDNPHNRLWKPMKLYRRSEVRARAHNRYGGLTGLQEERKKRQDRKFAREMEKAADVFK